MAEDGPMKYAYDPNVTKCPRFLHRRKMCAFGCYHVRSSWYSTRVLQNVPSCSETESQDENQAV